MRIREETNADLDGIRAVEYAAFQQPNEAKLVDALRAVGKLSISLVAEERGLVLGHVAFSPMLLEPSSELYRVAGLAPVAVQPSHQKKGIGSALIRSGLERARFLGYTHVVLLGDPAYYRRFGFQAARPYHIKNEYTEGDEFMILALGATAPPTHVLMKYQPEFSSV